MKRINSTLSIIIAASVFSALLATTAVAQNQPGPLSQIIIYKGEAAGAGTGVTTFKQKLSGR